MKKLIFISMLVLSMIGATACSSDKKEETTKETQNTILDKVKSEGKLVVGTEGTYPPFTYHDESGELTGFDVDIANEVGKRLGVDIDFKETQWDAMFAGLDAKRFDMIANQVGIKPERQEKYLFSDAYVTSSAALVVSTDNTEIQSLEDLKGKKNAQSLTSNYAEMAKKAGAEIVGVEGFSQAVELLKAGRVDATINDKFSVLNYMTTKKDANLRVIELNEDKSDSGLMFRKDSDTLVTEVNKALTDMKSDGTYDEIYSKYFGE